MFLFFVVVILFVVVCCLLFSLVRVVFSFNFSNLFSSFSDFSFFSTAMFIDSHILLAASGPGKESLFLSITLLNASLMLGWFFTGLNFFLFLIFSFVSGFVLAWAPCDEGLLGSASSSLFTSTGKVLLGLLLIVAVLGGLLVMLVM